MLITRGFGTGTGDGPGDTVYIPVTNPELYTKASGFKTMRGNVKLPEFTAGDSSIKPPAVGTDTIKTNIDLNNLQPKLTTNIPKF